MTDLNINYIHIISALLFLISMGSMITHRRKNKDAMIESSLMGSFILSIIPIASFILIAIIISRMANTRWYWSISLAMLYFILFANFLTNIYSSILGFKTKPQPSISEGGYIKYNIHIFDALITFALGLLLFVFF